MADRQTDRQTDRCAGRHTERRTMYALIPIIILLALCGLLGYKFIKHELSQNSQISNLTYEVSKLQTEVELINNKLESTGVEWNENSYKYFAIGNSITRHGTCEYWWSEAGMAASTESKDYVHVLSRLLSSDVGDVDAKACNFTKWELQYNDRAETLPLLDPYLSSDLDLVTIQLGENVTDTTTLESDFEELIRYIKDKCPDAQVLIIGQYWEDEVKDEAKKEACINANVDFVDLSTIFDKEDSLYNAGIGAIVYDDEGNSHTIEHSGVAKHPSDEGMEYIAEAIYAGMRN